MLSWVYLEFFSPVLLLLPMDFHVCVSTFDFVEHSEKSVKGQDYMPLSK